MAILTLNDLVAALLPPVPYYRSAFTGKAAGMLHNPWYSAGMPGVAPLSSAGLAGEALSSWSGQIPFPSTVAGKNIYLARMEFMQASNIGNVVINDRLWHNSGFVVTNTAAQAIASTALPSRDADGANAGRGVMLAMEVTAALGAGTPTLTVDYTNSVGTAGRTGTIGPIATTSALGTFYPMTMQDGDVGVRSVQSITSSATMTSGSVSFVLYRPVTMLGMVAPNIGYTEDAVALGLPRWYNGSVPFLTHVLGSTSMGISAGSFVWAQG